MAGASRQRVGPSSGEADSGTPRVRVRARVEGVVQGVGFRPFAYRLAGELGVAGFVQNDAGGVTLEIEGRPSRVRRFFARLTSESPPLAVVERMTAFEVAPLGVSAFEIADSDPGMEAATLVAPDTATCDACLAELFDPADRRYRYPFINCTQCGPRFTIVRGVPYDRPRTTMAGFALCEACASEYHDPGDRRFHAQPTACPACGPAVRFVAAAGARMDASETDAGDAGIPVDPVQAAARALLAGRIVAVKGIGGYHLACLAADAAAVARLRARKHRDEKPFALMVRDLAMARELAHVRGDEATLLRSLARPIVLIRRRPHARVATGVAPGRSELGLMLPYSPLHHLLLADVGAPLVMTSGNVSDEPIAFEDDDALERLAGIAESFLTHDRSIERRVDDSVVRIATVAGERKRLVIRRSRGYVPEPLRLPTPARGHVLACGAQQKNTFCLARDARAWVSHHIGDLDDYATRCAYESGIARFERLFAVRPEVIVRDMHPDYASTDYALRRAETREVPVQHHHAHFAACLAEHGERGPAVAAIFDGSGYGPDGTIWGGEILVGGLDGFRRAGHLVPVRMPGGEAAIREPWRMACAWLVAAGDEAPPLPPTLAGTVFPLAWRAVAALAARGVASPVTTSAGRLFDAVAALCGVRARVSYEGQAAIELEAIAREEIDDAYPLPIRPGTATSPLRIDPRPLIRAVARDAESGEAPATMAARFHSALAGATAEACVRVARDGGLGTVVLSGGVFQNVRLLERTSAALVQAGLRVLVPERLPPNDGGIAFGQAAIAAARASTAGLGARRTG